MFAKKALATLLIAAVPLTAATYASAASNHHNGGKTGKYSKHKQTKSAKSYTIKKKTGNKVTTLSTKHTNKGVVSTKRTTTTSKNGTKKTTIITKYVTKPLGKTYTYLAGKRIGIWMGKNKKLNKYTKHKNRSCVAAAKKRHGNGSRIWGVSGKKYGHNACDRAMNECRSELRVRKSRGKNPNARCVIVSRG